MKFEGLTPLTPINSENEAPVCTDGVCEVPTTATDQNEE